METKEFKALVDQIRSDNNLSLNELSIKLGKRKTYISETISRGKDVPDAVVIMLKSLFPNSKTSNINDIEVLKKSVEVLLKEVAKFTAKDGRAADRLTELKQEIAMQMQLGKE